jgi:hypothetical protein
MFIKTDNKLELHAHPETIFNEVCGDDKLALAIIQVSGALDKQ